MSAAQAEALIARHAPRLLRDAEALLAAAAWADLPAGVAVLPLLRPGASGISIGSGHALALAHGCRPGAVAVRVDVVGIMRATLAAEPDDIALAVDVSRQLAEHVAAHELAHALVAEPDIASNVAEATALVGATEARPARVGADAHGPRWAAAVVVLTRRVIRLRPGHEGRGRAASMQADLAAHGIDAVAVAEALGDVADAVALRELLAAGGEIACRVAAACRPEAERQAFIEHRLQHGAAGDEVGFSGAERTGAAW